MSEKTTLEPVLDDIAAAIAESEGKTPSAVLDAFLPKSSSHLGQKLVPLRAGHELILAQVEHPLSTGKPWEDLDILMALFIFSRPSRDLFTALSDGRFEAMFFAFVDSIPLADIPKLGEEMVAHWLRSRATALAMQNPHASSSAQKKTAVSDGG